MKNVYYSKNKGIIGGHNYDLFKKFFIDSGFDLDECIINIKNHPKINGIYEIEYRIPVRQYDKEGNLVIIPRQFKKIKYPKTVYDSKLISDQEILNWGEEAMRNGTIENREITGYSSNGLKFVGYINEETGKVTNFYPTLK